MLRHFKPFNVALDDDFNIPLQAYGELINSIAEGLLGEHEHLETMLENATTFLEVADE